MARGAEQRLGRANFDHLAQIHHGHPVRDMADKAQVVRHEHHGQMQLFLQLQQQVHHLRLNRHIQRRYQFIGHQNLGLDRESPCNADALALATGKFMRVFFGGIRRQADKVQQFGNPGGDLRPGAHLVH